MLATSFAIYGFLRKTLPIGPSQGFFLELGRTLLLYGLGAKLLRFSTIGVMQYIAPTMVFLIAVFVFHEPLGTTRMTAFILIWAALALYSWSMFSNRAAVSRN